VSSEATAGRRKDPRRRLGALGEALAVRHLEAAGYEVLDRNFRTRCGELDIVALDGRCLVFCEVKTRTGPSGTALGPLDAVGTRKQRRVRAMAREWFAAGGDPDRSGSDDVRFDVIGVNLAPGGRLLALDHVMDAF
jgi:putative endonuclease